MKKRKIREMDERVRTIGTRSWAYAGYSLFLLLYAGILVSGFVSITAVRLVVRDGSICSPAWDMESNPGTKDVSLRWIRQALLPKNRAPQINVMDHDLF